MHIINNTLTVLFLMVLLSGQIWAKENIGKFKPKQNTNVKAGDCNPSTAQIDLCINNVRARLLTGGDLWWDLSNAQYEVPKVPPGSDAVSVSSIFAGALWIGGIDQLEQLKVAAQTYRQTGNDFWPGPLDDNAQVCEEVCADFDQFFQVFSTDIDAFLATVAASEGKIPVGDIPDDILEWPGANNPHFTAFTLPENKPLAPFWDVLGDGIYDPTDGDYPVINPDIEGVYGDQMIWWVFNDKGNSHTETGGEAIGLEVGGLAFAFATNDEINNMTFYKYVVDNKSTQRLDSVFFGQWVDPDLGQFDDDFVGCVVEEDLGFVYNGDANDGEYGSEPPMLGVDFFKGPAKFEDVDGDGELDTIIQTMSAFVYYNNDFTVQGNPENASHFYGYMAGVWKDGVPFTEGGNARGGTVVTPYMFPGDPSNANEWSECAEGTEPADRRFLQVSGPFTLEPGTVNDVIVGAVWVREGLQYPCPSPEVLLRADKKAQALFDNNFKLQEGPDAPSIAVRELDRELVVTLYNDELISNNAFEQYAETDVVLAKQGFRDSIFNFEGYILYQLINPTISPSEYRDADKARVVAITDIDNGVSKLINWTQDTDIGGLVGTKQVESPDNGIQHSFQITEDLFAQGDRKLINNKKYYYSAVAYAYNAHLPYDDNNPDPSAQLAPYLEGRSNIKVYVGIPHLTAPEAGGLTLNSAYGDGPDITLVQGFGNGSRVLSLTEESIDAILASPTGRIDNPTYTGGQGPIDVKIFDPTKIEPHDFRLTIDPITFPELTQPRNGSVSPNADGTLTFTPNNGFVGYTGFNYTIGNEDKITDIASVVIKVGEPTTGDWIFDDTKVIEIDHHDTIRITENDFIFGEAVDVELKLTTPPSEGSVEVIMDGGKDAFVYTANSEFIGTERFQYTYSGNIETIDTVQDVNGNDSIVTLKTPTILGRANVYVRTYDSEDEPTPINAEDNLFDNETALDVLGNDTPEGDLAGTLISPFAQWTLTNLSTGDTYRSERNLCRENEQAIGGWEEESLGFSINITQTDNPSPTVDANLNSTIEFQDIQNRWMTLITDGEGAAVFNWIRAGEDTDDNDATRNDHQFEPDNFYDPDQLYETILQGRAAPYALANSETGGFAVSPACNNCAGAIGKEPVYTLPETPSVHIVLTDDQSKWTDCIVIEMARDANISEGQADQASMRRHPSWTGSVDGNGQAVYTSPVNNLDANSAYIVTGTSASFIDYTNSNGDNVRQLVSSGFFRTDDLSSSTSFTASNGAQVYRASDMGRSKFPGYAINLENGERLNMLFSENSFFGTENGKDMIWNPSSTLFTPAGGANAIRIGGEHFIYVMNSTYDGGQVYQEKFIEETFSTELSPPAKAEIFEDAAWVMLPYLTPGFNLKSLANGLIPSDVTINLNVARAYEETVANEPLIYDFSFADKAAIRNETAVAQQALDFVRVVPNPYYAFSAYETSQLDNRVRISNLPARADISVFLMDGTLIKSFKVDNRSLDTALGDEVGKENINSVDWDLKNQQNIPVASGIYLIHINAPDLGEERTVKFFVIGRPIDLDVF